MTATRKRFSKRALEKRLKEVFGGKCAMCQCAIDGTSGLEWDHILPVAMGGEDALEQLQPLCIRCHRAKTKVDVATIAKSNRTRQRNLGIKETARRRIESPPKPAKPPGKVLPPRRNIYGESQ